MQMPNGTFVLVTDGRKRLFFCNAGDARYPKLEPVEVVLKDNPVDRLQKTDSPGRSFASSQGGAGRSAFEETDFHQLAEADFAGETAAMLRDRALAHELGSLIVVADPRTLGELRRHYHPEVRRRIAREIDKDLVKHPVDEIERIIVES
jgi:protein required for attachment to host cells